MLQVIVDPFNEGRYEICHPLLCLKTRIVEPDRRAPSTSDAWFSSSLKIRQPYNKKNPHET